MIFKENKTRLQLASVAKSHRTAGRSHCFPTEYYFTSLKNVSYYKETVLVWLGVNVTHLNPSDTDSSTEVKRTRNSHIASKSWRATPTNTAKALMESKMSATSQKAFFLKRHIQITDRAQHNLKKYTKEPDIPHKKAEFLHTPDINLFFYNSHQKHYTSHDSQDPKKQSSVCLKLLQSCC